MSATRQTLSTKQFKLLIDGEYCAAQNGATAASTNPANGEVVAEVAQASADDVSRAVEAAQRAFPGWSNLPGEQRGAILTRAANLLRERLQEFAELETRDVGKTIRDTTQIDIPVSASFLEWYGGVTLETVGETIPIGNPDQVDFSLRQPYGVVGLISPWNFPLVTAILKIGPALAVGNTAIMKPASWTPLTTMLLGEVFRDAGLPPGVLNILVGSGGTVGEAICAHPLVKKIFFTGSTEVGQRIMCVASENVTDTSVELGGKSPNIIFADADWEQALAGATFGILLNNGQNCISGSRLLVERPIYDKFVAALAERFQSLRVGDPMDEASQLGSIVAEGHYRSIMDYIEIGKQEGATLACGGKQPEGDAFANGWFIEPTLFTDVDNKMRVAQEEIFGPVLVVIPFEGEDEAVEIANDTIYGLGSGVFTTDLARAHRVARRIEAGTVYVNTYNMVYPQSPFPGWKQSGNTVERGIHGLLENTRYKNVIMDISGKPIEWFADNA